MAYIYEIINDINGKKYIGKTEFDIKKRFREHCNDAFRERNEKRPLYNAMRKYGVEHFHISLIEETDSPDEREQYWIDKEQTYHYGYNATLGGDGKKYINYELIIQTYKEVLNIAETAKIHNVSREYVKNILKENGIDIKDSREILRERLQKTVGMYDIKNHNLIEKFPSTMSAAKYLIDDGATTSLDIDGIRSHITQTCNKQRKSAYGYFWEYIT